MAHFALITPPFFSHVRAFEAVAGELIRRGHRATFLHQPDLESSIRDNAVGFQAVGAQTHPPGTLARTLARAARPGGPWGLLRLIHDVSRATDMLCRQAPAAMRALGVDAVIADQMEPAGGLVAAALGLPFVSVACALPVNREPAIPLPVLPWAYDPSAAGMKRNRGGERVADIVAWEQRRTIARHAAALGLPPKRDLADCLSPLAQISQTVAGFDFPRRGLPAHFHAVGPLRDRGDASPPPLASPVRDDRPFVFASLGTLQGDRSAIFRAVAAACRDLDAQLLVAHCGGLDDKEAGQLGATWVTDFAPLPAVLRRADAVVTHAGLNTVLDALASGVPLLAVPLAFDQPGVAARIVHAGVGGRLPPRRLTAAKVRRALGSLLADRAIRQRIAPIAAEIRASGGARRAAGIIETAVATRRPVLPSDLPLE